MVDNNIKEVKDKNGNKVILKIGDYLRVVKDIDRVAKKGDILYVKRISSSGGYIECVSSLFGNRRIDSSESLEFVNKEDLLIEKIKYYDKNYITPIFLKSCNRTIRSRTTFVIGKLYLSRVWIKKYNINSRGDCRVVYLDLEHLNHEHYFDVNPNDILWVDANSGLATQYRNWLKEDKLK